MKDNFYLINLWCFFVAYNNKLQHEPSSNMFQMLHIPLNYQIHSVMIHILIWIHWNFCKYSLKVEAAKDDVKI